MTFLTSIPYSIDTPWASRYFTRGRIIAFILIIFCEPQSAEIRQSVDGGGHSGRDSASFHGRLTSAEGKHGLPIKPKVCAPEGIGSIGNFLVLKPFSGVKKSFDSAIAESSSLELLVGVGVLAAVLRWRGRENSLDRAC